MKKNKKQPRLVKETERLQERLHLRFRTKADDCYPHLRLTVQEEEALRKLGRLIYENVSDVHESMF
jgi:hypothetical protein